jgi:AcrR family transcriptional regulator
MPKLWNATIDQHRRAVREATMDATAALVAEHGLASVTMSQIAEASGIGRATLYKYFPDVESILAAWHEREATAHLEQLAELAARLRSDSRQLEAVLERYALIQLEQHGHHRPDAGALLHRDEHLGHAHAKLRNFFDDLLAAAAKAGDVRSDVPAGELAGYCLHALGAARSLPNRAAVRRLVTVTLAGLHPPATADARRGRRRAWRKDPDLAP